MAFDIGEVLTQMGKAAVDVLASEAPSVEDCVKVAIEQERDALESIAEARLDGEIDDEDAKSQIADEEDALNAALLVCRVKSKVAVQNAANAAVKVFTDALTAAIKAL